MLLLGGHRDDQAALQTDGAQSEEAPVRVHDGAAARPSGEWRGVLDASGDSTALPGAKAAVRSGDEPDRDSQPAAAGVGKGDDGCADARRGLFGRPLDTRQAACVGGEHREVPVGVDATHSSRLPAAVAERHGRLIAPQVVGGGQDESVADHDSAAAMPAAAKPGDRGADPFCRTGDRRLYLGEGAHVCLPVGIIVSITPLHSIQ